MTGHQPDVPTFIALLIVITLVAAVVRRIRLPYEVALVVVGLALAFTPGVPRVEVTHDVILTVFLPVLLFHGAYTLSLSELRASLRLVAFLALPGVIATAGLVGLALHVFAGLSWTSALLFGAIVAATDPVSVLAIFGQVGAPRRLTAIVSGESLFNDGTALVLFSAMVGIATAGHFNFFGSLGGSVLVIGGSLALGTAVGLGGAVILRQADDALVETSITLILAYGGYLLANRLALSGPLETVVAGLLLGTRGEDVMSPNTRLQAGATWEFLDFLANSLLFLLMGLAVRAVALAPGERVGWSLATPMIVALLAVVVARVVVVRVTARALAVLGTPLARGWDLVLIWAGLRGAVSLAAALSLPSALADRQLLLILTFGVVLFTLVGQGLTISPLLGLLGLSDRADEPDILPVALPNLGTTTTIPGSPDQEMSGARTSGPVSDPAYDVAVERLAARFGTTPAQIEAGLRGWWVRGLAHALQAYQERYGLSDGELAAYLQMPERRLARLRQQSLSEPDPFQFARLVEGIAESAGCNPDRLAAVLSSREGGQQGRATSRERTGGHLENVDAGSE